MKMIQTIADIEELKARNTLPLPYLKVIEEQFYEWFDAQAADNNVIAFRFSYESCIYHLEHEKDEDYLLRQLKDIKFVETKQMDGFMYFRIGVLYDHETNVIYFLEGALDPKLEKWLSN